LLHSVKVAEESIDPVTLVLKPFGGFAVERRIRVWNFALNEGDGDVVLKHLEERKRRQSEQ
jgi:hypothetical protein